MSDECNATIRKRLKVEVERLRSEIRLAVGMLEAEIALLLEHDERHPVIGPLIDIAAELRASVDGSEPRP